MIKNTYINITLILLIMIAAAGCEHPQWDEHYQDPVGQVDMNVWEAVKEESRYGSFVTLMEAYQLDSIFQKNLTYTLFIPDNDAFNNIGDTTGVMESILANHISTTLFLTRNVTEQRKLENLTGKFPLVSRSDQGYAYDMIPIEYSSPLFLDGLYYEIAEIAHPRPNLYEFTEQFSITIKNYIDQTDSVYLDISASKPIDYNSEGNTVYDSVYQTINRFERDFFPVSNEYRDRTATFILFTQDQYNDALDEMAGNLGPSFIDHKDIPQEWQFEVLLPDALSNSLFDDMLEYHELQDTMVSITGDTVYINPQNIDPDSRFLCSNGLTYTYYDFEVPERLYIGEQRIEGEELIDSIGAGTFAWKEDVTVSGLVVAPVKEFSRDASEEALVNVSFPQNYSGQWSIEFTFKNVFPMKYRLIWQANYRPSGNYAVYVNGQVLEYEDKFGQTMNEFDSFLLRQSIISVTGERFIPEGVINKKDYWVNNLTEFGDVSIRFEYVNQGSQSNNGFNIDYVALVPAEDNE